MTLEEFREIRKVSNTSGRPLSTLTDKKWQEELSIRKMFITPMKDGRRKHMNSRLAGETFLWNEETMGRYDGRTSYATYCAYINDVLKNIRGGDVDYCYYMYQILDLLRFHYDDLRTKYVDGYWEVWLER